MLKRFCDCCGKEIKDEWFKICSEKMPGEYFEFEKECCLECYKKVIKILEGRKKVKQKRSNRNFK